jgi:hypothetical protein
MLSSRSHLVTSLFAFGGTLICAVGAVYLIVAALGEHGSAEGKIFAGGLGFALLLISSILFTLGLAKWDISRAIRRTLKASLPDVKSSRE